MTSISAPNISQDQVAHRLIDFIFLDLLPRYGMTVRQDQVSLSHRMLEALMGRQIALHEAGVGIGKTFSYLVAAIVYQLCMPDDWWVRTNYPFSNGFQSRTPMPFVISTSSIALQQAILSEYIPYLSNILLENHVIQKPLRAVVRKGKGNYVCERRLRQHLADKNLNQQNSHQREALLKLRSGPIDLDQVPNLSTYDRKRVCVNTSCGSDCIDRFNCRYFRHMLDVRSPEILFQICNHNYLLADQLHRRTGKEALLPNYKGLIIDEAHKLSESAQQMYGITLTQPDIAGLAESIVNDKARSKDQLLRVNQLNVQNQKLFQHLAEMIKIEATEESLTLPFQTDQSSQSLMQMIVAQLQRLSECLDDKASRKLQNHCLRLIDRFNLFLHPQPSYIYQIISKPRSDSVTLAAIPCDVSEQMATEFWSNRIPAILTSGTLAIRGDFSRAKQVLGLNQMTAIRPIDEYVVPSPFDYQRNCLLYLPREMPELSNDQEAYHQAIAAQITDLVQAAHGHTLVLFNSYRLMSRIRELIDPTDFPCPLLVANRDVELTIERFKAMPNAVLFATGACWEGIDFSGDVVSSLIIVSLPFSVPDEVRRHEQLQYASLHEYIEASVVPAMQQKLKQGFGRAIRTEQDTCVISILDPRALPGARYHDKTMDALPECPLTHRLDDVVQFLRQVKDPVYFMVA